jgi:hypothetical protein
MEIPEMKPKQEYRPPRLHAYGDLAQMTKAASSGAKHDHLGGKFKTA